MSLHQKQYPEPEAIEVDPAKLHQYVQLLRNALKMTLNSYVENGKPGYPSHLLQKTASDALDATEKLYFPK